jgi:transposase
MITERQFERLLGLGSAWRVAAAEYETEPRERFVIVLEETPELWKTLRCARPTCGHGEIAGYDHTETRRWRHLDAFGKPTEFRCRVPRARCPKCQHTWRVAVPWEGQSKHFTPEFEAFALTLMREMPMRRAAAILGPSDTTLWRLLLLHVVPAYAALDLSDLVHVGVDEMNRRKGHYYLTVFADLVARRVVFATEGKDHTTFVRFAEEILRHNGHPKAIPQVAMDMSRGYGKGAEENLPNAELSLDHFHVVALANQAMDEVRRAEAREADKATLLKKTLYLFRKAPESLSQEEAARLDSLDLKHLAVGQAYEIKEELRDIYQRSGTKEKARYRLTHWVNWVRAKCERMGPLLDPMARLAQTVRDHLEGILGHWNSGLNTGFLEGLNSVFSAVKRKARGYRNSDYMIAMLYFVAGKLRFPCSHPTH